MSDIMILTSKQAEQLEADIPEILDYLKENNLISGKKTKTKYFNECEELCFHNIYDPNEVHTAEQKLAENCKNFTILRMLLKSRNKLTLHTLAYNLNIFKDMDFVNELLSIDNHILFDVYNNPELPISLIEARIKFIKNTYNNLPNEFFDLLFLSNSDGDYINFSEVGLGIVEECISNLSKTKNESEKSNELFDEIDLHNLRLDSSYIQHLLKVLNK